SSEPRRRYNGTDPDRDPLPYSPFTVAEYPRPADPRQRAVLVTPRGLELVEGGQLSRTVTLPPASRARPLRFEEIARAVGDPRWIVEISPGVFGLAAAFVQAPGTAVRFAAPGTTEIRLGTETPNVFIGGYGPDTSARFEGVKVTSWDLSRRAPSTDIEAARPFVLYEHGARLDIVRSEMAYLGSDRVGAYGVSWRQGGATGEVVDSVFHHCFFGVYTYEAADIVFRHNVFRDNIYYGFDPHDHSTGLVAEDNEAYGNGSHGFIVSRYVTRSSLRRNRSHHNGGNGIVLDFESNHNVVAANTVEDNEGDGIVILGSSANVVEDNVVRRNRVGLRANKPGTANVVRNNRFVGNRIGIEAYEGAADLTLSGNVVSASGRAGMILDAPGSTVAGGRISGGTIGIELRAATSVRDVAIRAAGDGVVVRAGAAATITQVTVDAGRIGARVEPGGTLEVRRSTLDADRPTKGDVIVGRATVLISAPPERTLPWLALAGITAVVVAVALECLAFTRERRVRRGRILGHP
ncbi:MAG: right-handed parallel beta-helix repeat-containing protein, partial [Acidimicrobiia bacterium]